MRLISFYGWKLASMDANSWLLYNSIRGCCIFLKERFWAAGCKTVGGEYTLLFVHDSNLNSNNIFKPEIRGTAVLRSNAHRMETKLNTHDSATLYTWKLYIRVSLLVFSSICTFTSRFCVSKFLVSIDCNDYSQRVFCSIVLDSHAHNFVQLCWFCFYTICQGKELHRGRRKRRELICSDTWLTPSS